MSCNFKVCHPEQCCIEGILRSAGGDHYKTFGLTLLTHVLRGEEHPELTLKLEEPLNETLHRVSYAALPTLLYSGMEKPDSNWCVFFCEQYCWSRLKVVVQLLCGLHFKFGEATYYVSVRGSQASFIWALNGCNTEDLAFDNVWFLIPKKMCKLFMSVTKQKFDLYTGPTFCQLGAICKGTALTEAHCEKVQLYVIHHIEEELLFLCHLRSDNISVKDAVRRLNLDVRMDATAFLHRPELTGPFLCQDNAPVPNVVVNGSPSEEDSESNGSESNLFNSQAEIHEMDLSQLIKEEEDHNEPLSQIDVESERNCRIPWEDKDSTCFLSFLENYYYSCRINGLQPVTIPPAIVHCPGCLAVFKGQYNGLLNLVRHVMRRHHNSSLSFIEIIHHEYRFLIDCMKKQMKHTSSLN